MEWRADEYKHQDVTDKIIGVFYEVYNELGYGFLESVYEKALVLALTSAGLKVATQYPLPVWFRGECVGEFRADLLVSECVVVEVKAVRTIESAHEAQVLNYLKASKIELGLVLNFGPKPQIRRLAFSNSRKKGAAAGDSSLDS